MISIVLVPYTLHRLFGGEEDDREVVKTWSSKKDKRKPSVVDYFTTRLRSTFTLKMIIAWTLYALLLLYVKSASAPMDRFDPFEILQVSESASEADIKKAYRKLSLQYHPDKNPDPAAADYFAEYITKAYRALTDEASRENFKKYGHPDGQQAVSISVALPEWFFNKDKEAAPAILLTLLLGGIVLPLGLAACYMGKSNRYTGANEVMMETIQFYMFSPFAIKQYQSVGRLPETLICAMEFLPPQLHFGAEQGPALEALRRAVGHHYPEVRDTSSAFFRKRHAALVKAHMLLLAHMSRIDVDQVLKKDLTYILEKAPRLLQEMFNIASAPRIRPNYGWLTPTQGTVELMQCIVKAVPAEEKKKSSNSSSSKNSGGESTTALLQLPHVNDDVIKKLNKQKLRGLSELQRLNKVDRRVALQTCGLSVAQVEDIEVGLSAIPTAFVSARIYQDDPETGEESTADASAMSTVMTCCVHTMVLRAAHQVSGFNPESITKGKNAAIRAYAPNFPFPRDEHWFFLLGDPSNNALLAWTRVSLLEAEAAGARYASNWMAATGGISTIDVKGGSTASALMQLATDEDEGIQSEEELLEKLGQKIELKFVAPAAGKHDLVLYVMPDSWVGLDRSVQLKIRTIEPTRAEKEGRAVAASGGGRPVGGGGGGKSKKGGSSANVKSLDRSEESEAMMAQDEEEEEAGEEIRSGKIQEDGDGDGGSGSEDEDDEEEDEEEEDREYDSDEYGTEESGSDNEEESGTDDE
ncbi:hypothetical protein Ndes2526B_g09086 [Nannochloris sp. 'desiccata']|nr:hypothetical protein KSW81_001366 [Chlorella desiccata (nom. nud.)]KAH7616980.1 putative DnaJ protein ERDJ2 [Chlorella desiccata (nom. nud.)]